MELVQRRWHAWSTSDAPARLRQWREGRVSQGQRWVLIESNNENVHIVPDQATLQGSHEVGPSTTTYISSSTDNSEETTSI